MSAHPLVSAALAPARVPAGSVWHHIFQDRFPDPLGFGYGPSRFSDPRLRRANRFGVYYVGATFEVAFLEAVVRDRRDGNPAPFPMTETELSTWAHVPVTVRQPLDTVDLRDGACIALGVSTDTVRARAQAKGRKASLAVWQRREQFDGILYQTRLNTQDNIAVYDRAVPRLDAGPRRRLNACPEIAPLLERYNVVLV